MGNFRGVGKFLEGLRRLVKKRLTMGKPENLFLFVERMTKKPCGRRIRFSATCGKHHQRTITRVFFVHAVESTKRIQLMSIRMACVAAGERVHLSC